MDRVGEADGVDRANRVWFRMMGTVGGTLPGQSCHTTDALCSKEQMTDEETSKRSNENR